MLCWGSTKYGQLGLGAIEDEIVIEPTENRFFERQNLARVKQIALGYQHTLFLLEDGTVYSCGNNDHGQLGHDGPRTRPELIRVLETHNIVYVACGHSYSLALNNKNQLLCWGAIAGGSIEDGNELLFTKPTVIKNAFSDAQIVQIACGYHFFLMLTEDGKVYAMGRNNYGQLGLGTRHDSSQPVYLKSLQGIPVMQIACGAYHSMILSVSGQIFAFGKNEYGQLGLGDTENRLYPNNIKSLNHLKVRYAACGQDFTAVLTLDGGVFTFGAGMYGQLGHNSKEHEYVPRKVFDLMGSEVTQIACGRCHTLAYVASSCRLFAFGLGGNGQLGVSSANGGNGSHSFSNRTSPSPCKVNLNRRSAAAAAAAATGGKCYDLLSIHAGGDHSFILHYPPSEQAASPLDYRKILDQRHILTIDTLAKLAAATQEETTSSSSADDQANRQLVPVAAQETLQLLQKPSSQRMLQTVFASASCLNASCLDPQEHYNTSNRYPGVDLRQAKAINKTLTQLNDPHLVDLINTQLTALFNSLPDSPPSVEALRLYVLTPFLTNFDVVKTCDNGKQDASIINNMHSLLFAYAHSINMLRKESAARVLDYWFAWTGPEFFRKLISTYKNVVRHIICLPATVTDKTEIAYRHNLLKSSLLLLQKMYRINIEFNQIAPYDMFYIPELIDKVDIRQDYVEWLRRKSLRYPYQVYNMINLSLNDSILFCDYPFVFDGRAKTLLLQADAEIQMQMALNEALNQNFTSIFVSTIDPVNPFLELHVRRSHIVQDTLNQLSKQKRDDLKKPLRVTFDAEEAVDAGGVRKEFFMLLLREILDEKYGMFMDYDETHTIWFSDQMRFDDTEDIAMFYLIGQLFGLAIYNSIIIDMPFPLVLYKKLLKEPSTLLDSLNDMESLSPTVARNLRQMLEYEGDDFEQIYGDLTFEITRQRFDQSVTVELVADGAKCNVTKENRKQYVQAYLDYVFTKSVAHQFNAFSKGFHHVCGSKVLELFHSTELMAMVIGNQNYDWQELEKNAEYKGVYYKNHEVIKRFWKVFHELDLPSKKKFLIFLTGTDRIPILGMKGVKLIIQPTHGGDKYFPVAHTCFNLLDLPQYTSEELLRERLLTAIEHNRGFTIV